MPAVAGAVLRDAAEAVPAASAALGVGGSAAVAGCTGTDAPQPMIAVIGGTTVGAPMEQKFWSGHIFYEKNISLTPSIYTLVNNFTPLSSWK